MTPPGRRLRTLARRVFNPSTMERLIDPVIADLQCEHAEAIRLGQLWRSRWVQVTGYVALVKVATIAASRMSTRAPGWAAADGGATGRIIGFSGIATIVTVAILVWVPLRRVPLEFAENIGTLIVYLVPQALAVAIPIGLVIGVLCGLRGRVPTLRSKRTIVLLMLAASLAALVLTGWLLPVANQAYRELAFALLHPDAGGRVPARGMNELTLGELMSNDSYQFHFRLSLAGAPLVLGLFSMTIATARRGRYGSLAIVMTAVAICFGYYFLLFTARESTLGTHLPAAAAWTPNLAFVAMALLLPGRKRQTNLDKAASR
jgi:hypothetical protein